MKIVTNGPLARILLSFATTALLSSPSYATRWWEGDIHKEITSIKKAVADAEPPRSATGYEDKGKLLPLIKDAYIKNQTGGADPVKFARLVALVYRGRNAIGIESEEVFKASRRDIDLLLKTWTKKVDSITFVRTCLLYTQHFAYAGLMPPKGFINKIRPKISDDLEFDECLAIHMAYNLKDYTRLDILTQARKLAKSDRAKFTRSYAAFKPIFSLAMNEKSVSLMKEAVTLLKFYHSGMQTANREDRKQIERHIEYCESKLKAWK